MVESRGEPFQPFPPANAAGFTSVEAGVAGQALLRSPTGPLMKIRAKYFRIAGPCVVLLALLGGLAREVLWPKQPPGPMYHRKRSGEWLAKWSPETDEAVHQLGTNAIPTLLQMLRARDSKMTTWLVKLARKQHLVNFTYTGESEKNFEAAHAFEILGADASEAVPELIRIFKEDISDDAQNSAAWSLGAIGPAAAKAIPTLLNGTTSTYHTRRTAIDALGRIHAQPELVVPALVKLLKDPDWNVRASAITSLESFGADAKPAVSALTQSLNDQNRIVLKLAQSALEEIDPDPAAVAEPMAN